MSKSKAKGTAAETAVVNALRRLGWPHVERRALQGTLDKGDIAGMPGVCWEVKDAKTWQVSGWLQETMNEMVNAGADYGILVIKPPRIGHRSAEKWLTVMDDDHASSLWNSGTATLSASQLLPCIRTIKAMGLDAGIAELLDVEKELAATSMPPLGVVRVKRRLTRGLKLSPVSSYYNLMRLDARCRLLTYADYGSHAIMSESM